MKKQMFSVLVASTLAAGGMLTVAASASDGDACNVPTAEWQPIENLQAQLEGAGWKIEEIEEDDGCYEVEGINAAGEEVDAYFDPKTFEQVADNDSDEDDDEVEKDDDDKDESQKG